MIGGKNQLRVKSVLASLPGGGGGAAAAVGGVKLRNQQ